MARTQDARQVAVATPLGAEALLFSKMVGTEELGRLFQYELTLLSEDPNISLTDVIGQNISVRVEQSPSTGPRYFNGFVSKFALVRMLGKTAEYRATMVPWLWFLTRTSDCRIFQDKTVPEIIKQVFSDFGFTDIEDRLTGTYRTWEYCVQYSETAFNFVSRLMEQEAIFYYFKHENGKHTLVLANADSTHDEVSGYEQIQYRPPTTSMRQKEYIHEWAMEQQVQPGVYSHTDFNFKKSKQSLLSSAKVTRTNAAADYEIYEYPGEYEEAPDGEAYARRRIEEYQTDYAVARGEGDVRGITTGFRFALTEHPRTDQCANYLVTRTEIEVSSDAYESVRGGAGGAGQGGANFAMKFFAVPLDSTQPFRPRRITPLPRIRGPQTAIVVGPSGEEIYSDEFGRVKVQFHWDRYSQANENSSCWIRVAQGWAGKKWGILFTPRIGQEVIVEFLEGDPDRPLITGRVYNDYTMPPYDPKTKGTISTMKSLSSKGGDGFNEFRFEDKKGSEQIFLHAEKDQDIRVKNDSRELILHDSHQVVGCDGDDGKVGDRLEMTYRDKHVKVHRHQQEQIGGNVTQLIGGVDGPGNQDVVVKATKKETIDSDSHQHVKGDRLDKVDGKYHQHVAGDRMEKVDGSQSLTVGMDQQEKAGMKFAVDAGTEIHLKGGMKVVIEAGMQLTLKAGASFIDISPAGISIVGSPLLNLNSGGSPGSGGGSSPTAPSDAADATEAAPTAPALAADAETGEVTTAEGNTPPTPPTVSGSTTVPPMSPQAGALQDAAQQGTPFCEKCQAAQQQQEADDQEDDSQ